jgi:integrase
MSIAAFSPSLSTIVPRVVVTPPPVIEQRPRALTVNELFDDYIAAYSGRDKSVAWRLMTWRRLIGERPAVDLTTSEIREHLKKLQAEPARAWRGIDADNKVIHRIRAPRKSWSTVNRYQSALSAVLQWAIEHELLPQDWRNPARGIKRGRENPGVVRFLDADERRRLLDAARASEWARMYGLVLFALTSGARRGELLALRWRDVDLDNQVAYLRMTKNGSERALVIVPAVAEELRGFGAGKPEHLVFRSTRDPLRAYKFEQCWRGVLRASKVEKFRFHDLRHSFASALAQEGASLIELADALGHKSMRMVQRYAHFCTASRSRLVNRVMGEVR